MTDRLSDVRHHIGTVAQLGAVVNAMRGMAAAHAAQARALIPAVHAYEAVATQAIAAAMRVDNATPISNAAATPTRCLVVFGPEQGFCGALADRLLEVAAPLFAGSYVLVVGSRLASLASDRGLEFAQGFAMPTRAAGLTALATRMGDAVAAWLEQASHPHVAMILPRWTDGQRLSIDNQTLLPVNTAAIATTSCGLPPLIQIPLQRLLAELADEHLFARLCEGTAETFAAENECRVATMASAASSIEHRLTDLRAAERLTRQEEITAEVVELAAGAGARRHSASTRPIRR